MGLSDLSVFHKYFHINFYILYLGVDITVKIILHYTQSLTVSGMLRLAEVFGSLIGLNPQFSLTSLI